MRGKKGAQFLLVLVFSLVLFSNLVSAGEGDSYEEAIELIPGQEVFGNLINDQDIYYKLDFLNGEDVEILMEAYNREKEDSPDTVHWMTDQIAFRAYDRMFDWVFSETSSAYEWMIDKRSFLAVKDDIYYIHITMDKDEKYTSFDYKLSYTKQCREGYSNDFMSCEGGNWIQKPVTDVFTGEEILASDCGGCLFFGKCFPLRYNFTASDGKSKFCESDGQIYSAKLSNGKCEESYQCASPLSCADGTCLDMREVKDEESGDSIYAKDCSSCLSGDVCYSESNRFNDENKTASYCSVYKKIEAQKDVEVLCSEDYECLTNECSKGKCIDTMGFIESIWSSIKGLFGL